VRISVLAPVSVVVSDNNVVFVRVELLSTGPPVLGILWIIKFTGGPNILCIASEIGTIWCNIIVILARENLVRVLVTEKEAGILVFV